MNHVLMSQLTSQTEEIWSKLGNISESMNDIDKALYSYENVLRNNPYNMHALNSVATILRLKEQHKKAIEYLQRILNIEANNGEIWSSLGHCYLMIEDLQKAYFAYQQALYFLPNPKDPKLWYGIGILYDTYGSIDHAEDAFSTVLKIKPNFEKANEIYFRLGIIYKQQRNLAKSIECFNFIIKNPPVPLTEIDIMCQLGQIYELEKKTDMAKEIYSSALKLNPKHTKVLQQFAWLYHSTENHTKSIKYLLRAIEIDPSDEHSWYLLGRCYMVQKQYRKAYDAYQQAVYRDGKNPTYWCSIGVLYYQINQYSDALDAYTRSIRLNPYMGEVWFNLGSLYEACDQLQDSFTAYKRAAELEPNNPLIQRKLQYIRNVKEGGVVAQKQDMQMSTTSIEPSSTNGERKEHDKNNPNESNSKETENIPKINMEAQKKTETELPVMDTVGGVTTKELVVEQSKIEKH